MVGKITQAHSSLSLPPTRYLYLVNEAEELLAIFSLDHLTRELEIISYEARLRASHNVDDPESGIVLRDSVTRPLPGDVLARAWRIRKR